ncbi:hypothetical protein [Campylobacter troglodytis]|uniref:hypothetical protein n=1 Tax=Campylobacter troglodytis TaxID=654363 RepID=UPI00163C24A6|nr:hypothetical protein [Campylobacter troglodytis]
MRRKRGYEASKKMSVFLFFTLVILQEGMLQQNYTSLYVGHQTLLVQRITAYHKGLFKI